MQSDFTHAYHQALPLENDRAGAFISMAAEPSTPSDGTIVGTFILKAGWALLVYSRADKMHSSLIDVSCLVPLLK